MFGWNFRLSVDAFLGTDHQTEGAQDHSSYVHKLKGRMAYAYRAAAAQANKYSDRTREIRQENPVNCWGQSTGKKSGTPGETNSLIDGSRNPMW